MLLCALLLAAAVALKIAYYREGIGETLKTTLALFWLFVLPGYALTLHWKESMSFLERVALGTAAALAMTGIVSYYLGITWLKIQHQTVVLPAAIIIAGLAAPFALSLLKILGREKRAHQPAPTQQQ